MENVKAVYCSTSCNGKKLETRCSLTGDGEDRDMTSEELTLNGRYWCCSSSELDDGFADFYFINLILNLYCIYLTHIILVNVRLKIKQI